MDPKWLRETLDKSGIRWRVIVISACYSGSFIPAFTVSDTLIITASAADKTSLGVITKLIILILVELSLIWLCESNRR